MQGERRAKRKAAGFSFSMPSRRLLYVKAVLGECRAKRKAVLSERKGNKKRKFLICLFRTAAGFMQKPQDFLFPQIRNHPQKMI